MNSKRALFVLKFSNFLNNNIKLFESSYKLLNEGKSKIEIDNFCVDIQSTNLEEREKPKDVFQSTMILMYSSMKQLDLKSLDDYISIDEEEIEELFDFIEYARTKIPYFINFLKEEK